MSHTVTHHSFNSKVSNLNEEATLLCVERVEKKKEKVILPHCWNYAEAHEFIIFMKNSETLFLISKDQLILY